jgi:hypothetical protein
MASDLGHQFIGQGFSLALLSTTSYSFGHVSLFHGRNIYNAYILKQRSIGATSEMHPFPAKVGAKYAAGPTELSAMDGLTQSYIFK